MHIGNLSFDILRVQQRALMLALLSGVLSACAAQKQMSWVRPDGKPPTAELLEIDRTICRGETQKSNLAGFPSDSIGGAIRRSNAVGDVFTGCMAQRGWMMQAAE